MILATEVTEIAEHRVALLSALCALCGYFLINANALSIGRATTARLPTSTIGRWIRFGSATIAFITSRSGVSSVIPAAAVHGAGGGGGGTPHDLKGPQARFLDQLAEILLSKGLVKIIDLVVSNAVFTKQRRQIAAGRSGRFFVNCYLFFHPYTRAISGVFTTTWARISSPVTSSALCT